MLCAEWLTVFFFFIESFKNDLLMRVQLEVKFQFNDNTVIGYTDLF